MPRICACCSVTSCSSRATCAVRCSRAAPLEFKASSISWVTNANSCVFSEYQSPQVTVVDIYNVYGVALNTSAISLCLGNT